MSIILFTKTLVSFFLPLVIVREKVCCIWILVVVRWNNLLTEWQDELASSNSSVGDISSTAVCDYILTHGRAWAISITQRSAVNEEISRAFMSSGGGMDESLLYRFASLMLSHSFIMLFCFNNFGHFLILFFVFNKWGKKYRGHSLWCFSDFQS